MKPGARRAIASLGIVAFLVLYVWAAIALSIFVPDHWLAELLYFGIVGISWGFPLYPLLQWSKNGSE